ncbi:MAG: biotin--[Mailhella sp.]|nr:biotin--[acetyl-CoA-carboxylase] ligase [Mailhella sp.]
MPREEIPMHDRVMDLLISYSRQDWISGETISAELGISRAAVGKHIASLREEGNIIEAAPRRGYRLISQADPWAMDDVQKGLLTRSLGQNRWIWLKETDSTNQVAAREALEGAPEGVVVVARRQSEGRGSKGHSWINLPGSLHFSVIIRLNWPSDRLNELTLLTQEACAAAVVSAGGPVLECRKPNDLFLNDRKVSGVLVESMFYNEVMQWAVIGIGMNVNTPAESIPEELRDTATSLYAETGQALSVTGIMRNILEELEQRIG